MKKDTIIELTTTFEELLHFTEHGVEFWFARDLQHLLGYEKWDNFQNVINKAKVACNISGYNNPDHFADVGKMVSIGSNAQKEIEDLMLTRFACYLIAQNGDPRKEQIAFAQTYFALQTRKLEIIESNILAAERVNARKKLKKTEKELSHVIFQQTGQVQNFSLIRSKGDKALFNKNTQEMKNKWGIGNKPLADFMPSILLKAKDFATEITVFNTKQYRLNSEKDISDEHINNNVSIRKTLISRGITPEDLPPEEDVKKIERKLSSEECNLFKDQDTFNNSESNS
jgi:DNA-damage-inducible protein D